MQLPAALTIDMSLSLSPSLSSFVSCVSKTTHTYVHTHVQQPTAKCSWLRGEIYCLYCPHIYPVGGNAVGLGSSWEGLWRGLGLHMCLFVFAVYVCGCMYNGLWKPIFLLLFFLLPPPPLVSPVFVTLALPPLLFHPSWLCPSPPFFPPSILLSAGRRWVMPLAGRLKLSPSSSKYIFSIPLLPCLFYVSFSPSSLTLLSARRHHLFLDISRLCSVAPVGALPWFFCFSPSVWKSDSSAVYVSIILSFSPSLSPTVHPAVLTLPCLLAVMMWTHILFTLPIYCVYTLL